MCVTKRLLTRLSDCLLCFQIQSDSLVYACVCPANAHTHMSIVVQWLLTELFICFKIRLAILSPNAPLTTSGTTTSVERARERQPPTNRTKASRAPTDTKQIFRLCVCGDDFDEFALISDANSAQLDDDGDDDDDDESLFSVDRLRS